jgi:hypothetical protein
MNLILDEKVSNSPILNLDSTNSYVELQLKISTNPPVLDLTNVSWSEVMETQNGYGIGKETIAILYFIVIVSITWFSRSYWLGMLRENFLPDHTGSYSLRLKDTPQTSQSLVSPNKPANKPTNQVANPSAVFNVLDQSAQAQSAHENPAKTTQIESPILQIGDSFVLESVKSDNQKLNNVTEKSVISVESNGDFTLTSKNQKSSYTRIIEYTQQWNVKQSREPSGGGLEYSPPIPYFDFPLYPGKKWSRSSNEINSKTGARRLHTIEGKVYNWEQISVPAGTFQALKVSLIITLLDFSTGKQTPSEDISWYVPQVKRSVKSEITSYAEDGSPVHQTIQLLSYHVSHGDLSSKTQEPDVEGYDESIINELQAILNRSHCEIECEYSLTSVAGYKVKLEKLKIDINADGEPDYLLSSGFFCGASNCMVAVLASNGNKLKNVFEGQNIAYLPQSTNGFRNLVQGFHGEASYKYGNTRKVSVYQWNGNAYLETGSIDIGTTKLMPIS